MRSVVPAQDGKRCAGVKDPLLHISGASSWVVAMEKLLGLEHPVLIFNPPEFEIGNAISPSPLSSHFGEKVIKLLTANVSIVLKIDPDSVGPQTP